MSTMSLYIANLPEFGSLKVRVGGSSTGKTNRIMDNLEIASRQTTGPHKKFKKVLVVRPERATFDQTSVFKSHNDELNIFDYNDKEENNVNVCVLKFSHEDSLFLNYSHYDLYLIDDGHLYSEKIAWVIAKLIQQGKNVYFVGRQYDSQGKIFPTTYAVMQMPEVTDYKVLYNPWQPQFGKPDFKLRFGPMFSTKTKKVIKKAKNTKVIETIVDGKLELSPARILIVRPENDKRFDDKYIFTTHAGKSINFADSQWKHINVEVIPFGKEQQLLDTDSNLIIFEEGQFFSPKISSVLTELNRKGIEIYFTALLHDFQDKVFPTSATVMQLPGVTNIRKLWAQCNRCQEDKAFSSVRFDKNDKIMTKGPQLMIGDEKPNEDGHCYGAIHLRCKKAELGLI